MQVINEVKPNIEAANVIFDGFNKTDTNWEVTIGTVAYLVALVYSAGSENKPKKIEMMVAFPESELAHKRNKGYKITIEQTEEASL